MVLTPAGEVLYTEWEKMITQYDRTVEKANLVSRGYGTTLKIGIISGIDAIDPLQITNPVRQLKDKYQDRVTFVGGYDNQGVYDKPGVTEEEIRAETARTLHELAPGGSFVAFPLTITFDFVPVFIDEHMKHAFSFGENA